MWFRRLQPGKPARQTRSKSREIERLNSGMKVTLMAEPTTTAYAARSARV
jgi:hypothetical protein